MTLVCFEGFVLLFRDFDPWPGCMFLFLLLEV